MQPGADLAPFVGYGIETLIMGIFGTGFLIYIRSVERRQDKREERVAERDTEFLKMFGELTTNLALMNQRLEDSQKQHIERYERLRAEHREIQGTLSRRGIGQ